MTSQLRNACIVLAPTTSFPEKLIEFIGNEVARIYGWATRISPLLSNIDFAFDVQREQYLSTAILAKLAEKCPPDALKVLAITDVDLFIPILTYVYGEAQLGGKACIISTHRLRREAQGEGDESRRYPEARIVKEAIHELGHTFRLRHCPEPTCIMHYCRSIDDVDRKSDQLCRHCKVLLGDEVRKIRSGKF